MGFLISIAKAKAALASLIARAEAGEEITLTRHGKPVARLVPMAKRKPFKFGDLVKPGEEQPHYTLEDLTLSEDEIEQFYKGPIEDDELYRKSGSGPNKGE